MLQQIRHITESAADGIIEQTPTLRGLFDGYAQEPDACSRHERFKEVIVSRAIGLHNSLLIPEDQISNRKDGVAKSRILNQVSLL
jgi:hypothetical protein